VLFLNFLNQWFPQYPNWWFPQFVYKGLKPPLKEVIKSARRKGFFENIYLAFPNFNGGLPKVKLLWERKSHVVHNLITNLKIVEEESWGLTPTIVLKLGQALRERDRSTLRELELLRLRIQELEKASSKSGRASWMSAPSFSVLRSHSDPGQEFQAQTQRSLVPPSNQSSTTEKAPKTEKHQLGFGLQLISLQGLINRTWSVS